MNTGILIFDTENARNFTPEHNNNKESEWQQFPNLPQRKSVILLREDIKIKKQQKD